MEKRKKQVDVEATPLLESVQQMGVASAWSDPNRPEMAEDQNGYAFSTVQLVNSMIGSGILSFPFVFANVGLPISLVLLGTFGYLVYVTSHMLMVTGEAVGKPEGGFSEVIASVMGSTWRYTLDLCVVLICFGALLTYLNVIGSLSAVLFAPLRQDGIFIFSYAGCIVLSTVFFAPACFLRAYGELAPISSGSLLAIALTTLAVVVKSLASGSSNVGLSLAPSAWYQPIALLGNYAYSTNVQNYVFENIQAMQPDVKLQKNQVVGVAISLGATLLVSMGVSGSANFGTDVETNILQSLNMDNLLTKFVYGVTIFHLILYIPNDFIIMRLFACKFFDVNPLTLPDVKFYTITTALLVVPVLLMALIPAEDVGGVFELIIALTGAIPATIACYLIPTLAYRAAVLDRPRTVTETTSDDPSTSLIGANRPYGITTVNVVLAVAAFTIIISPIVTVTLFVNACLSDEGCKSFS